MPVFHVTSMSVAATKSDMLCQKDAGVQIVISDNKYESLGDPEKTSTSLRDTWKTTRAVAVSIDRTMRWVERQINEGDCGGKGRNRTKLMG